ncbi:MAG: 2-phospho-L-lactate transferase [Colwellia sp.]
MTSSNSRKTPKITLICGGVGGTKLAEGFYHSKYRESLKIIGNVADDQEFHGLWVSPDIDTLTYTLAGVIDTKQGWGRKGDSQQTLASLRKLGVDTWMFLGDKDFATHIFRTELRKKGVSASKIARKIAKKLKVTVPIILPTDSIIQTQIKTDEGWLFFQDYFVKKRCEPEILDIRVQGIASAKATSESLTAISEADLIVIAPSNPMVSISPIINIPGIKKALLNTKAQVVAVSPFFSGTTIKGPADKMMFSMGFENSNAGLSKFYQGIINTLVIDESDAQDISKIKIPHFSMHSMNTLMRNRNDKTNLANSLVSLMMSSHQQRDNFHD